MNWVDNKMKRVILDNGSHLIRYGSAQSDEPENYMLNLVGIKYSIFKRLNKKNRAI
jgi:actin-related protein